jgi:hypothetical protein
MGFVQAIRLIDSRAWQTSQGAPFQFARWLAALTTVIVNWALSGPPQSTVAYLPVLTAVALLLLPDAKSIEVAGLRYERLTNEISQQRRDVDTLRQEVSLIGNSLTASSHVNITVGASTIDAATPKARAVRRGDRTGPGTVGPAATSREADAADHP